MLINKIKEILCRNYINMRPFLRSFGHWRFAACSLATGSGLSYCESPPRPLHANFIADAAEIASPAVVNLKLSAPTHRFQYGSEGVVSGSGFFLSQDGFIVTNAHVVAPVVESMNRMELMVLKYEFLVKSIAFLKIFRLQWPTDGNFKVKSIV